MKEELRILDALFLFGAITPCAANLTNSNVTNSNVNFHFTRKVTKIVLPNHVNLSLYADCGSVTR